LNGHSLTGRASAGLGLVGHSMAWRFAQPQRRVVVHHPLQVEDDFVYVPRCFQLYLWR
jgi:hypothetical protein